MAYENIARQCAKYLIFKTPFIISNIYNDFREFYQDDENDINLYSIWTVDEYLMYIPDLYDYAHRPERLLNHRTAKTMQELIIDNMEDEVRNMTCKDRGNIMTNLVYYNLYGDV